MGFQIATAFARRAGILLSSSGERFEAQFGQGHFRGFEVGVLKPLTFMNESGRSVAQALSALPVDDPSQDLLLLLDDVDLPFAQLRLRAQGGDAGHRGLRDVLARTGPAVPRLRFGIGRPVTQQSTHDFVLEPFDPAEQEALPQALARAVDAVTCCLDEGPGKAMNRFNSLAC